MPELPEVETIRLGLQKYLVGHTIEDIEVRLPKMVSGEVQRCIGSEVQSIRRFGKALIIDLDNNHSIAIHVKMTGQLIYKGAKVPKEAKISEKVGGKLPNQHTHVIFYLSQNPRHPGLSTPIQSGSRISHGQRDSGVLSVPRMTKREENAILYYNDIRQFGWIKIVKTTDVSDLTFFKDLGPEPLNNLPAGRQGLTIQQFSNIVKAVKSLIKPLLMDQKKISGIGNIYANEALYLAKIHPKRPAASLSDTEIKKLFNAIETVLKKSLETGGSSEWQYVNALGEEGSYQKIFQIYGQVGKPCKNCGTTIQKITLGGRGTFFCAICQH